MDSPHKKKNIAELTRISAEDYRRKGKLPFVVVCDSVRSMHNIGAIFRTADAFLFSEIILCGISGRPPHPEIHKTALGAEETVKWHYEKDVMDAVRRLADEGWKICVLEQAHDSVNLADFKKEPCGKYALVVGNEVNGVAQEVVDMADIVLEIPQEGTKHSLNVSVSAALAMWRLYTS